MREDVVEGIDVNQLEVFSLFKGLTPEQLGVVARYLEPRSYRGGEYIFAEGQEGDELYLLVSGSVRVLKKTKAQEEYTIVDLSADYHIFFGEIALIDSDKRSASIMVLEDCLTYVLNRSQFAELGKHHPEIALPVTQVIAGILCGRLRNVNNDVILLFDALVGEIEATQL